MSIVKHVLSISHLLSSSALFTCRWDRLQQQSIIGKAIPRATDRPVEPGIGFGPCGTGVCVCASKGVCCMTLRRSDFKQLRWTRSFDGLINLQNVCVVKALLSEAGDHGNMDNPSDIIGRNRGKKTPAVSTFWTLIECRVLSLSGNIHPNYTCIFLHRWEPGRNLIAMPWVIGPDRTTLFHRKPASLTPPSFRGSPAGPPTYRKKRVPRKTPMWRKKLCMSLNSASLCLSVTV